MLTFLKSHSIIIYVVTGAQQTPPTTRSWEFSSAGRASALQAEGHRFEPCRSHLTNSFISYADVAQLAEQLICNQQVIGSSPIIGFFEGTRVLEQGPLAQLVRATGS